MDNLALCDRKGWNCFNGSCRDLPGVAGRMALATRWRCDHEAAFATCFCQTSAVFAGCLCDLRVACNFAIADPVEPVNTARWRRLHVSVDKLRPKVAMLAAFKYLAQFNVKFLRDGSAFKF